MDIENDPLESPPTVEQLQRMATNGMLSLDALERGLKIINHTPDRGKWERFLNIILLILGSAFTVSGIFFFFAFNWADMHRFVKLGLLEAVILILSGLAIWLSLDKLSGKITLGAVALIIGALIAVYGQIYQTGADSYQLFLTWALLITGWVLISKFTPIWFLWIMLFNMGIMFYWLQIIGDVDSKMFMLLFALNGGIILTWEIAHGRGVKWLKSRWTPRIVSLLMFGALVIPTVELIFLSNWGLRRDPWLSIMPILFIVASLSVLYVYSQKILDLFLLTICAFSLIVVFNIWMADVFENLEELLLFCLSGLFIGQAALVVTWLRKVSNSWGTRKS